MSDTGERKTAGQEESDQYGMFDSREGIVRGNIFKKKRGSVFWEEDHAPMSPKDVFGDAPQPEGGKSGDTVQTVQPDGRKSSAKQDSRPASGTPAAEERSSAESSEPEIHTVSTDGNTVLCGSNSYNRKFYINPMFSKLPDEVKKERQIMCVWFTEDVGGILTLEYEPDGTLVIRTASDSDDYLYDEIGAGLELNKMKKDRQELLTSLELYYRAAFLHQKIDWEGSDE